MRARLSFVAVPVCLFAVAVFAPSASADLWCVTDAASGCSPDHTQPMTQAGLTAAIDAAQSHAPGDDQIEIGAGTIDITSQISVSADNTNNLMIEGAGSDTLLHFTQPNGTGIYFGAGGAFSTGIDNLRVKLDGTPTATQRALWMYGGTATNISLDVTASGGYTAEGLVLDNGASCDYCEAALTGNYAVGIYNDGPAEIRNSVFRDSGGATQTTIGISGSGGDVKVYSSRFIDLEHAATYDSGNVELYDSVIDMGAHEGAEAIYEDNDNNSTSTLTLTLDGVTVVGDANQQRGLYVEADTTDPAHEYASATVMNSLFLLTGSLPSEMRCVQGDQGVAAISVDYTLKLSGPPSVSGCTATVGAHNIDSDTAPAVTADDLFVNYAGGDLRLKPGAPVIDKGDPATNDAGRDYDAFHNSRFVDGGTGVTSIDLGGGEYQNYAPERPSVTAAPTSVQVGVAVQFAAAAGDANGDALTYDWDFGDGAQSAAQNPAHAFSAAGTYNVRVRANDGSAYGAYSDTIQIIVTAAPVAPPSPSVVFGKPSKKFVPKKGAKRFNGFKVVTKKPAGAYIPVTSNVDTTITLTLKKKGAKVAANRQNLRIPAGKSYLVFGFRWKAHAIHRGTYTVSAKINGVDSTPARISTNFTVGK